MKQSPVKVTIVLPEDLAARLDTYAQRHRRSRSNAATVLIEEGLRQPVVVTETKRERVGDADGKNSGS